VALIRADNTTLYDELRGKRPQPVGHLRGHRRAGHWTGVADTRMTSTTCEAVEAVSAIWTRGRVRSIRGLLSLAESV
jgi:hypothetical protein